MISSRSNHCSRTRRRFTMKSFAPSSFGARRRRSEARQHACCRAPFTTAPIFSIKRAWLHCYPPPHRLRFLSRAGIRSLQMFGKRSSICMLNTPRFDPMSWRRSVSSNSTVSLPLELVLAHSSAFCPAEVFRVLAPSGILLTAQGASPVSPTLADVLEGPIPEWAKAGQGWDIDATLDGAGFEAVEKLDVFPRTTYRDIGAVVYVLLAVPWMITDFTVKRYRKRLYRLHLQMKQEGGFTVQQHHRLLEMRKPAATSDTSPYNA